LFSTLLCSDWDRSKMHFISMPEQDFFLFHNNYPDICGVCVKVSDILSRL